MLQLTFLSNLFNTLNAELTKTKYIKSQRDQILIIGTHVAPSLVSVTI